jgi:hypothetical protein
LLSARRLHFYPIRRLRHASEAGLTMIVDILYGAAAVGVGVYMLWALIKPEQF